MVNSEQENLLTVREVARRCNRSEETIRRWIWSGKLAARKLGNQLFVEPGDIDPAGPTHNDRLAALGIKQVIYDIEEIRKQQARERNLRERLFKKHGYFDVATLVRESREGH